MICKIKRYGIGRINNDYSTISLPKESAIIGVIAKDTEPGGDIIQLLVEEPICPKDHEVEMEEHKVLVVHDELPYGEALKEGEFLAYVGTVLWDNAYKIHHVFEVANDAQFTFDDPDYIEDSTQGLEFDVLKSDLEDLKLAFERTNVTLTHDENEPQKEED